MMKRRTIPGGARYEVRPLVSYTGNLIRGTAYGVAALAVLIGWPA